MSGNSSNSNRELLLSADSDLHAPLPNAESYIQQLDNLQLMLQQGLPEYEGALREIHSKLSQDPTAVHLLPPEKVAILIAGLKKKTGTFLQEVAEKKRSSSKSTRGLTIDDL